MIPLATPTPPKVMLETGLFAVVIAPALVKVSSQMLMFEGMGAGSVRDSPGDSNSA